MNEEGEMVEEEEMLLKIMKNAIILKRGKGTPGMKKILLLHDLNILLFMLFLVPLLQIIMINSW